MTSLEDYLEALASAQPTPGGGSAATIVGALAAALVAMVARITAANPKFAAHTDEAARIAATADDSRHALLKARIDDEAAYGRVVEAMAMARDTAAQKDLRASTLQTALKDAAAAPMRAARHAAAVLEIAGRARALGNTHLMSDVDCAEILARGSVEASIVNVRVNHQYIKDAAFVTDQEASLAALEAHVARIP